MVPRATKAIAMISNSRPQAPDTGIIHILNSASRGDVIGACGTATHNGAAGRKKAPDDENIFNPTGRSGGRPRLPSMSSNR